MDESTIDGLLQNVVKEEHNTVTDVTVSPQPKRQKNNAHRSNAKAPNGSVGPNPSASSRNKRDLRKCEQRAAARDADTAASASASSSSSHAQRRGFDMSVYGLRHVALKVAYIGTNYSGFASQQAQAQAPNANAAGRRGAKAESESSKGLPPSSTAALSTVEEQLFLALEKTCLIANRKDAHYSRCGRTDRGALGLRPTILLTPLFLPIYLSVYICVHVSNLSIYLVSIYLSIYLSFSLPFLI